MRPDTKLQKIAPDDLVCMNSYVDHSALRINLAYAHDDNLLFGERIYRKDAKLYLYKDLAKIVRKAADLVQTQHNLRLVLYDGLRTTDAQEKMLRTQRVKDNPNWLEEPRLLSPPGAGGHPRGMAVDITLETMDGALLDMGTPFDYLAENAAPAHNPAHRDHPNLTQIQSQNRLILHNAILGTGFKLLDTGEVEEKAIGLAEEWWDFRFPSDFIKKFAPLSDQDLPPGMRLIC